MISFLSLLFVAAEVDVADVDVDVAEADAAAADFENESGAVETAVLLKECAWHWHDCWGKIVDLLQKKASSS